ncbi:FecCD family ABC transporter permease [Thermoflexus sp.]|uniref:FecCD family ABC transporter permease n=1 Tax=Thermoflexus sp. TaxID=1969742 RepID=UPI0025DD58DD|nr:iron ABC transporter permease [Thermoflexus sp.]MDW8180897.1 iron ABC transporter permease [Anaerolineae bacterium]MCS6964688.1 iron ABC transporter permease [Thermoflexus sp.]MCS7351440.1 iron ABC transporter permease [Thermoflexus sp.]MCX7690009.1 iron ABC transporter permease [Thermoflexus sp.]MDW8184065.1 iron ABC transporter permease [Anaerolineae bacterium]
MALRAFPSTLRRSRRVQIGFWAGLGMFLGTSLALGVALGTISIPLTELWRILLGEARDPTLVTIVWEVRLPRVLLIALAGAALAGAGAAYQGLFRNPLADPYLIGVAAGANLGALTAIALNLSATFLGLFTLPMAAFLGGLATVGAVYRLARIGGAVPLTLLLLAGIVVGAILNAISLGLLMVMVWKVAPHRAWIWMLGGYALGGWPAFFGALPYVTIGLSLLLLLGRPLDVLQFGEEQALQLGLPVEQVKRLAIGAATLTTAGAVAFTGIIGFVGLIAPHLARLIVGPRYPRVLPASILIGASLLTLSDLLSRILLPPQEIPLTILTAFLGGPFFLYLLIHTRRGAFF